MASIEHKGGLRETRNGDLTRRDQERPGEGLVRDLISGCFGRGVKIAAAPRGIATKNY